MSPIVAADTAPPATDPALAGPASREDELLAAIRRLYGAAPAHLSIGWLDRGGLELFVRSHSVDFRTVRWDGQTFYFTEPQAAIVKVLWEERARGTPEIGKLTLLRQARSDAARVESVFKVAGARRTGKAKGAGATAYHAALGTMIVTGISKGTLRLAE